MKTVLMISLISFISQSLEAKELYLKNLALLDEPYYIGKKTEIISNLIQCTFFGTFLSDFIYLILWIIALILVVLFLLLIGIIASIFNKKVEVTNLTDHSKLNLGRQLIESLVFISLRLQEINKSPMSMTHSTIVRSTRDIYILKMDDVTQFDVEIGVGPVKVKNPIKILKGILWKPKFKISGSVHNSATEAIFLISIWKRKYGFFYEVKRNYQPRTPIMNNQIPIDNQLNIAYNIIINSFSRDKK